MTRKMTAAELMAKLDADPGFVERRALLDEEHQKREEELATAEAPLVEALLEAGARVTSVWALVPGYSSVTPKPAPFPEVLPLLLDHLSGSYPEPIREGIARALGAPEAKFAWPDLIQLFKVEQSKRVKDGLAAAIAAVADSEVISDVISLVSDTTQGSSRVLLLDALRRSKDPRAYDALQSLAADPELEEEIRSIVRGTGRER